MDLQHLRGSDGTGEAVLAHIDAPRSIGSTVLSLDNVDNWNSKCIVVTGTPNANGYIAAAGMKVMYGHLNAGDFIIDGFAPGYTDAGNTTSEVAIIKMTTSWADALVDILKIAHNDNGTIKNDAISSQNMFTDDLDPVLRGGEYLYHYAASGLLWTADSLNSTRNGSMSTGIYYCNGKRISLAAVVARAFTASKDTYIIADSSGVITYTEVANGGTPPTLTSSQMFLGMIVTGASAITKVFQMAPRSPREIARCTLSQGVSDLMTAPFLPKQYLRYKIQLIPSGNIQGQMLFNNDNGSNYAHRYMIDNTLGSTVNPASSIGDFCPAGASYVYVTGETSNYATHHKMGKTISVHNVGGAGASTAPAYVEFFHKWTQAVSQINRIDVKNASTGDFAVGSEIVVYGEN